MYLQRIVACLVASVLVHALAVRALGQLPEEDRQPKPVAVTVQIVSPPPAAEPPPELPPPPPEAPKEVPTIVHEMPTQPQPRHARLPPPPKPDAVPRNTPPSERAATSGPTTDTPQFGFSLESTSESGSGPAMPVGNTLQVPQGEPSVAAKHVKPLAAPVPVYEVTKMPEMIDRDRCIGKYTDAAREAGIEGAVTLQLVVDEEGKARDIKVIHGLGHGLDEACIEALKRCRFSPGLRGGQAVPVRVPRLKVNFSLDDEE